MRPRPNRVRILLVVVFASMAYAAASGSEASLRKAIAKIDRQIAQLNAKRNILERKLTGREYDPFTDSVSGKRLMSALQATADAQPSMTKYRKLKIGMTVAQSKAAIGQPGVEVSRIKTSAGLIVIHRWSSLGPNAIFATYVNDKLVARSQYGLD